jgi:glycerol uptake facilitator-like aquaporin
VNRPPLRTRAAAEALGTALLVAGVVGSGIAAQRLSPADVGLQLLENALATAAVLAAVIPAIGPVSGAHLNPVVTLVDVALGHRPVREVPAYVAAQIAGACLGAIVANAMFAVPLVEASGRLRSGGPLWISEIVATFGLVLVVFSLARRGDDQSRVAFAVAAYIAGAYWFTSSTSFANPAVTVGRTLTDTFSGIAPSSAPAFIVAQLCGAALAGGVVALFRPRQPGPEARSLAMMRSDRPVPTVKERP